MNNRMMDDVTAGTASGIGCSPHPSEHCKSCGSTSEKERHALDQLIQKGSFLIAVLGSGASSEVREDACAKLKSFIAEL